MGYVYKGYTDVGARKCNEDSFVCVNTEQEYLFVVADGLGGHGKGEIASTIVTEELNRQFLEKENFDLETAISDANMLVLKRQDEIGAKMKTTVAVAWIGKSVTKLAHVGDSRIYAFLGPELKIQTVDHSAAQVALQLDPSMGDVRNSKDRNVITRALGNANEVTIELSEISNEAYDRLLLCSDGFWEYVLEEEMCKTMRKFQTPSCWLRKMRRVLMQRIQGENDNNTAIAIIRRRDKR